MTEEQLWAIGAGVVALLVAIVVSVLLVNRTRGASAARLEDSEARTETRLGDLQRALQQQGEATAGKLGEMESMVGRRLEAEGAQRQQHQQRLDASLAELRADVLRRIDEQAQQTQQHVQQTVDALGQQVGQVQQAQREVEARVGRDEHELNLTRTQVVLAQAVAVGFKARTHLSEQNTGLAQHDLTALDAELQRALALAPDGLKPRIEEVRRSLGELKEGVEARTFPVAAVEMLADRVQALITAEPAQATQ